MKKTTWILLLYAVLLIGCGTAAAVKPASSGKLTQEVSGLTCSQLSFTGAGTTVCTVNLNSAVTSPGGKSVAIGSSNLAVTVPASVVVPRNSSSTSFAVDVAQVSSSMAVVVTATLKTTASVSLQLSAVASPPPSYSVDLSWQAPVSSTDPVSGYDVYRSSNGGSTYALLNTSAVPGTVFTDSTVQSGAAYQYYVASVDAQGNQSGPSNVWSATIP